MTGFIYFLQAQTPDEPVKIGFTKNNPYRRAQNLQTGCPWPIKFLGCISGTVEQEKQIHVLLASWRTRGEWFEASPIVMAAIDVAMRSDKRVIHGTPQIKYDHPLCRYRAKHGLTLEAVARKAGITKTSLSRFESGKQMPNRKSIEAIVRATSLSPFDLRPDLVALSEVTP